MVFTGNFHQISQYVFLGALFCFGVYFLFRLKVRNFVILFCLVEVIIIFGLNLNPNTNGIDAVFVDRKTRAPIAGVIISISDTDQYLSSNSIHIMANKNGEITLPRVVGSHLTAKPGEKYIRLTHPLYSEIWLEFYKGGQRVLEQALKDQRLIIELESLADKYETADVQNPAQWRELTDEFREAEHYFHTKKSDVTGYRADAVPDFDECFLAWNGIRRHVAMNLPLNSTVSIPTAGRAYRDTWGRPNPVPLLGHKDHAIAKRAHHFNAQGTTKNSNWNFSAFPKWRSDIDGLKLVDKSGSVLKRKVLASDMPKNCYRLFIHSSSGYGITNEACWPTETWPSAVSRILNPEGNILHSIENVDPLNRGVISFDAQRIAVVQFAEDYCVDGLPSRGCGRFLSIRSIDGAELKRFGPYYHFADLVVSSGLEYGYAYVWRGPGHEDGIEFFNFNSGTTLFKQFEEMNKAVELLDDGTVFIYRNVWEDESLTRRTLKKREKISEFKL